MFLLPAFLVLGFAMLYPVVFGIRLSFFEWALRDISKAPKFIGLSNYIQLFKNEYFHTSVRVTFIFTFSVVIAELFLGLVLALLVEEKIKGLRVFRTIFVLPIMIAPVVVGVTWRFLYDPEYGYINFFIRLFGGKGPLWLADPQLALLSIIITDIWQWTPFVFLLVLAGLQGIPRDLLEAGVVDGTSPWQNFWHIKLPMIKSVLGITAALRLIDAFRGLVVMYIMTYGGPGMSTQILSLHLYKTAFVSQRLGLASAIAVILLLVIAIVTIILMMILRQGREQR